MTVTAGTQDRSMLLLGHRKSREGVSTDIINVDYVLHLTSKLQLSKDTTKLESKEAKDLVHDSS